jgi:hypothetical protein
MPPSMAPGRKDSSRRHGSLHQLLAKTLISNRKQFPLSHRPFGEKLAAWLEDTPEVLKRSGTAFRGVQTKTHEALVDRFVNAENVRRYRALATAEMSSEGRLEIIQSLAQEMAKFRDELHVLCYLTKKDQSRATRQMTCRRGSLVSIATSSVSP